MSKLDKGGVVSNIDLKDIDPATRFKGNEAERHDQLMTDAKTEARAAGPGSGFAVYLPGELEGKAQDVAQKAIQELHREDDPRSFPRGAIAAPDVPGGFVWRVDDRLREQIIQGKKCPNCLQLQAVPGSAMCRWKTATTDIDSCGFSPLIDDFPR